MLAASDESPNTVVPKPSNWCGVADGLARAETARAEGRLNEAERILIELLEFAPHELRGWKMLAHVQRDLGKIHEGIQSATTALRLQQERRRRAAMPASLRLAKLLWQQGEQKEALRMLDELLVRHPEDAQLMTLRVQWQKRVNP